MACDFSVTLPADCRKPVDAACTALDEIDRVEEKLSIYREDSELSCLNRSAAVAPFTASGDVYRVLRRAVDLYSQTGGSFEAAAGALVRAWGFYRGPRRVPSPDELAAALAVTGSKYVRLDDRLATVRFDRTGIEFNLGAIGKGYAIDRAVDILRREHGISSAFLQGGRSSVRGLGAPPSHRRGWPVDIGHPVDATRSPVARLYLRDRALGTSGAANQFFMHHGRRYGHVLDPRTGWPAAQVLSASVVAGTATDADALSTAFFVMGEAAARQYCRQHDDVGAILTVRTGDAFRVVRIGCINAEVSQ
jgi:thiamine biosynthesis lipoprotein